MDCKSISLPTSMEIKRFHVPRLRGFLHLVVAAEMDTPSQPPLPHAHIYMLTHTRTHRKEKNGSGLSQQRLAVVHDIQVLNRRKVKYSLNFFKREAAWAGCVPKAGTGRVHVLDYDLDRRSSHTEDSGRVFGIWKNATFSTVFVFIYF